MASRRSTARRHSTDSPDRTGGLGRALWAVGAMLASLGLILAMRPVAAVSAETPPVTFAIPLAAGVPEPGAPLFTETFSAQVASSHGISILDYTGSEAMTYNADRAYTPAGGQCDGWVMSALTPQPAAAEDSGCAHNEPDGWSLMRQMATDLGLAQGMTTAEASGNQALTEYTNSANGTVAAGDVLRTGAGIPAMAGHYYAVSAYFAEANCHSNHASMTFGLVVDGVPTALSAGLDPCTAGGGVDYQGTRIVNLQSDAIRLSDTGTPSLGLFLRNESTEGNGNDVAFDLPQIIDLTPSLDKSFSPSTVDACPTGSAVCSPGSVSTLTFTVTNTSELAAKDDWHFNDSMPTGLRIAPIANLGGSCASTTGAPLVRTATVGSASIEVTGADLQAGQASCTVTVDVVGAAPGTFTNDRSNVTTNLLPPDPAVLTVVGPPPTPSVSPTPSSPVSASPTPTNPEPTDPEPTNPEPALTLDKEVAKVADANGNGRTDEGDAVEWTFLLTNAGTMPLHELSVDDPMVGPVICPEGPLAPGESVTCRPHATYAITDADVRAGQVLNVAVADASTCPRSPGATAACSERSVESNEDETETPTDGSTAKPALELDKRVAEVSDENGNGRTDVGDTITFDFQVTNVGKVVLKSPGVDDPMLGQVTCPAESLRPGASTICTAPPYVITPADGTMVRNVATASAEKSGGASVTSDEDVETVAVEPVQPVEFVAGSGASWLPNAGGPTVLLLVLGCGLVLVGGALTMRGRREHGHGDAR